MKKVNHENKMKRCRHRLNEYFDAGDIFATWTYEKENRPKNLKEVKKDFQKAIRVVKNELKKAECILCIGLRETGVQT